MNKRFMLSLLGVGALAIVSLGGFCAYKMQGFKHKLQESLNANLAQISQGISSNEINLSYAPFACSGIFFIECKSPYISFKPQNFSEEIFTSSNLILSLKEIDFGSITLNAKSDLKIAKMGDLQEYTDAFFPKSFDLSLKIKPQNATSYTLESDLSLDAQNALYSEKFTSLIDSPKVKEIGLFEHISSFAFLDEGLKIKNLEFSLLSKDLSEKLFEIAKSKYGKSLNKQAYDTLATFLAAMSIEMYANKPYYAQIKDLISGFLGIALGKAEKMSVFISPKSDAPFQPSSLNPQDLNDTLQKLFSTYNFTIKLTPKDSK